MKKLLQSICLLIILGFGLSSCKTASIMKRHYNKGYYVSKKHDHAEVKYTEQTVRKEQKNNYNSLPAEFAKLTPPENKKDVVIKDDAPTENDISNTSATKKERPSSVANAFSGKDPFNGISSIPRDLRSGLLKQDDVARDALSLIWVIIVVLLIVYIVGLILDLFGIGPIFHILAAIILVLLILWLLRII